jgi:hypothetical protein
MNQFLKINGFKNMEEYRMNLTGKQTFNENMESVWEALHNPDILKAVIPGCQSLTLKDNGEYDVVLKLGIAAVKGEYIGKVKIEDVEKPTHYILQAEGSGSPGHVNLKMDCYLSENESGCTLDWDCNAEIGGMIASVGSRVLTGVAKFMAGKFFKDLKREMKKSEINS